MSTPALPPNRVLTSLESRGEVHGTWVQTRSVEACQAAAACGYDFVIIDLQHGAIGLPDASLMIGAVRAGGATAVIRLPDSSPAMVGHLLDAGAQGILVPDVRTAEDCRRVVAAATYPAAGSRTACPSTIASLHGAVAWSEYRAWADSQTMVWALIEHPDAVADVEAIVSTGVHALVLGPFDLSLAMGADGDVSHPDVVAALARVTGAAARAGVETVAVLFDEPEGVSESARRWRDAGSRILTASSDRWALTQGWSRALQGLRR